MSDSCVVLFVNLPAEYRLHHGLECLHANDETGLFHRSRLAVAGRHKDARYDRIEQQAGPGMPLKTYVPKGSAVENWDAKIKKFLTPSGESAAVAQRYADLMAQQGRNFTRVFAAPDFLRMKEKRLDLNKWLRDECGRQSFPALRFHKQQGPSFRRKNVREIHEEQSAPQSRRRGLAATSFWP